MVEKIIIIAEAGVNHNGNLELAKELVDKGLESGADFIKFQVGIPELVASRFAPKAAYQEVATGITESQLEMIKKISLTFDEHRQLKEYCDQVKARYLCTPFDIPSIDFLESLGIPFWKIPSGEITNYPYLRKIGKTRKPVVLSTGMANLIEISDAIKVLVQYGTPTDLITLLHCTTEYPAPKNEINLRAMETMCLKFGLNIGYSDHTQGIEIPIAAVAMGATIIEKHFTLDRNMIGPDHAASLDPTELKLMVEQIRNIELAFGTGIKEPSKSEVPNMKVARKSIVAARKIVRGEIFSETNITTKRPGIGISPMEWESVIGQIAVRDFQEDEPIQL